MKSETKNCQNCKKDFVVEPDDFLFYEKMKVPPPTFCPECRMIRRFAWRNERILHHIKCDSSKKQIISGFSKDSNTTVFERDIWWSDNWDAIDYGINYDFSKNFFIQFRELLAKTPMPSVFNAKTVNCKYCQHVGEYKNGYFISASWEGENNSFASRCNSSKECMDVLNTNGCELCYEVVSAVKCYKVFFSHQIENCASSILLFDCKNCQNCFACSGLRNKSYCILNKQYSKEDYKEKIKEIFSGNYSKLEKIKIKFLELKAKIIRKYSNIIKSEKVTGNNIKESYNCKSCFDIVKKLRDCKYIINGLDMEDSYDGYGVGANSTNLYELFDSGIAASNQKFGMIIYGGSNIEYSYNCHSCNNIFGCISLKNKQYCILNKQYTKEEYEELVPKIIKHMNDMPYIDKKGNIYKYGEFFPSELSPFAYNETVAQEYFPLIKEEALEQGYRWKEKEERNYPIDIKNKDIPNNINDVNNEILNKVIECEHKGECNHQCTEAFKIVPDELQFYQRMNIPIPHLCPNCRHYARLQQRNPMKLWHRKCQCSGIESDNKIYKNTAKHPLHNEDHCPNEFETSYSPNRPEIVYCEKCYQAEVY